MLGFLGSVAHAVLGGVGKLVGPLVAGAFGYAGQHSANVANAKQAKEAEEFSAAEAEKNRQFQADQSATAYQRAVKDLKAAGLNPALAYQQGGASTPSGSTASGVSARMDSSAGAGINSASRAFDAMQSLSSLQTQARQRENIQASTAQSEAQADLIRASATRTRALLAAELNEITSRGTLNTATAALRGTENRNIWDSYPIRMAQIRADTQRSVSSAAEANARALNLGVQRQLLQLQVPEATANAGIYDGGFLSRFLPYFNSSKGVLPFFHLFK